MRPRARRVRAADPSRPAESAPRTPIRALALAFTILALATLGAPGPVAAQDRSIVIESMDVVYQVREDGAVDVEERFRVRFNGSWNGLQRVIELDPPEGYAWDDPIGFGLTATTDGSGQPLENGVQGGAFEKDVRVWVPDANDRTANVVIRYTLEAPLGFFAADAERGLPGMDEFYWQVTPTGSDVPVRSVSAEVRLPRSAQVAEAAAYQGGEWSNTQVPVTIDGSRARVESDGEIGPGEGLTIAVGWPPGSVERDPARVMQWGEQSFEERLKGATPGPLTYLPLLLPFVVFWFAYRAWDARGRDPKERSIMVRWEPPADLSPAEVGTLVDHTPHMHDIIATLVELAVKGFIVIEEEEKEGFLKFGTDYVFHLVRPRTEWGDLPRHQHRFLDGLFENRGEGMGGILKEALGFGSDAADDAPPEAVASVRLSDLKNEFYKEIPDIKDAILDALVRKGHYLRRPDKARQAWIVGAALLAAAGFGGFVILIETNPVLGVTAAAAAGVSAIIFAIFGYIMPARTEKGARAREAALGFKQFLEKVENPRYKRMIKSPAQFEEFLPFAMAFQCQDEWASAFDDLLTEPPDWYYGHHGRFHATAFATNMGQMASTAGTAMASSPSSSGSGGGGSVGGGGGGGSVGGF